MSKIHLVIPWYRPHMWNIVREHYRVAGVIIHPIVDEREQHLTNFMEGNTGFSWVQPVVCPYYPPWPASNPVNSKINHFISSYPIDDDDYYWIMGDDDYVPYSTMTKMAGMDDPVVFISMMRGNHTPTDPSIINRHPTNTLIAHPDNVFLCGIGYEQMIIKGYIFKRLQYDSYSPNADGKMAMYLKEYYPIRYAPEFGVMFNYYEPGRWDKPTEKEEEVIVKRGKEKIKLVIATPFYEMKGWTNYIASLAKTLLCLQRIVDIDLDFWSLPGDSYIERARNTLTNMFMRSEYTHFLFIDSDMGWDIEGVLQLLAADEPLVGAGFPCKNNWDFYGCKLNCNHDGTPVVNSKGLISSWNVPTGFCMIKKEVFLKLKESFPDHKYLYQAPHDAEPIDYYDFFGHYFRTGSDYRDDVYFCRKWASIGGDIWVEPRINMGHAGFLERRGNYHEFLMSCPGGSNHG